MWLIIECNNATPLFFGEKSYKRYLMDYRNGYAYILI